MKALVTSGLLLLALLVWPCSGQQPVLVECTYLNLRVIAKRALFYPDELVGPDELFLGTGCQAIYVRSDELEFDYPIGLCGTTIQAFCDGTALHTWLTYIPRNGSTSAELPLQCVVPSFSVAHEYIVAMMWLSMSSKIHLLKPNTNVKGLVDWGNDLVHKAPAIEKCEDLSLNPQSAYKVTCGSESS
ncbi:oocyte-secreted protein 3-like [Nannospalax galili]|uniref:oocyte-secreted protein 3-like n=1 Tax=Nannospalax galili TaxID=1026970 RepID=UPI0004ED06F5|nr:oocyte-secreted protein 3-like [Nannospalax galili]